MRRPLFVSASVVILLLSSACSRGPDNSNTSVAASGNEATSGNEAASGNDTIRSQLSAAVEPAPSKGPNPEAVAALRQMSDYLTKLNSFDLVSTATLDAVTKSDQRIQIGGVAHYKIKKPGMWLDFDSDLKSREYFFDGKNFTIYSPKLGFYATTPAPPTNRELLKLLYDKYGISLPLADLFRWNDADDSDVKALTSGFLVGPAMVDGVPTQHWAFRQGKFDWEIWIEDGAQPLPRKLSIIDRSDPTRPTYTARLQWHPNSQFPDSLFTFKPDKDAKRIQLAQFKGEAR
jgi:hypothetical protein